MAKYEDDFKREVVSYIKDDKNVTINDAAAEFNVSVVTIKKWLKDKTLFKKEVKKENASKSKTVPVVEEVLPVVEEVLPVVEEVSTAPNLEDEQVEGDSIDEVKGENHPAETRGDEQENKDLKTRRRLRFMGYI